MLSKKNCVAMLLAGGQGSRLGVLTAHRAKPAVPYGGKYRIIDFPLSNCAHSGIDTVGVLTQYQPLELNSYIGTGASWDLDTMTGGAFVLPPYEQSGTRKWYTGTANAIYQNIFFVDRYNPNYMLVLSGDHIYKMDYNAMISYHEEKGADVTIAVIKVPLEEASRFGILNTDEDMKVVEFDEKPKVPKNDMASMGVYVFNWEKVRQYLIDDENDESSSNDFGKNILPTMLEGGEKIYAYEFNGYWKDVGTLDSLWEANMDLLQVTPEIDLYDPSWRIFSRNPNKPPHYVSDTAQITNSIISEGCFVYGEVENSVLFSGVTVEKGAVIKDSIVMQETTIAANAKVTKSIVDENVLVLNDCEIGGTDKITVIGADAHLGKGVKIESGQSVAEGQRVE